MTAKKTTATTSEHKIKHDEIELDDQPRCTRELEWIKLTKYLKGEKKIGLNECVRISVNNESMVGSSGRAEHIIAMLLNLGGKVIPTFHQRNIEYNLRVAKAIEKKVTLIVTTYSTDHEVTEIGFETTPKLTSEQVANLPDWNDALRGRKEVCANTVAISRPEGGEIQRGLYLYLNETNMKKSFLQCGHDTLYELSLD